MGLSTTYTETDYKLQELQKLVVSGLKGILKITDAAPTVQGLYILSNVGTYINLGGLVAAAGKLNYAYFDGTTWKLIAVEIPNNAVEIPNNVVDNLTSTSTNEPLSANMGRVLDETKLNKGTYIGTASDLVPYKGATKNVNIGAYYFESSQGFKKTGGTENQALTADGNVFDLNIKADLIGGKVPSSQLPSYVDDVLEFANLASFPATGESGKIYIAIDTNLTYRWGGSSYVVMSSSLALGETSETTYRGDRGKIAYDHSQITGNPHGTTKADIGLGNVDNTSDLDKPISTATQKTLDTKLDKGTYTGTAQSLKNEIDSKQNLLSSFDESILIETDGNIESNVSLFEEYFEQQECELNFTPIQIVAVYQDGIKLLDSEYEIILPKKIRIKEYVDENIEIQYTHLK
jgi:hypothetical protein